MGRLMWYGCAGVGRDGGALMMRRGVVRVVTRGVGYEQVVMAGSSVRVVRLVVVVLVMMVLLGMGYVRVA